MENKTEPTTNRIKRLLEVLISYTFNLCCLKATVMILNDFLSQMKGDQYDLHEVTPITFNSYSILRDHYNTFRHLPLGNHHVVTRSKTEADGTQLPKVHWVYKVVNQPLKPETQVKREGNCMPTPVKPDSAS